MIQHIVAFKFLPGLAEERLAEVVSKLNALAKSVPGVLSLSAGISFISDPARSLGYDVGLAATFADKESLSNYIKHPEHQAVLKLLRETMDSWLVIDYEI
ncbi:MAG TPA: Dabb family protein [Spirochaetia bacterium]|nr:Dabb family protein [Spirochaetia bacterium]